MDNIKKFKDITAKMAELYEEKNKNYDNAFDKSLDEDGLLVSKIRLSDKLLRFNSLIKQESKGTIEESLYDTLMDLANYSIMTMMWLNNQKDKEKIKDTMFNHHSYFSSDCNNATVRNKIGYVK